MPAGHVGHNLGPGGVGSKRPRDEGDAYAAGDERAMHAAAMHHMPSTDKMDAHINRLYRAFAIRSEILRKEGKQRGAPLDPRRLPDASVRALLRRAW